MDARQIIQYASNLFVDPSNKYCGYKSILKQAQRKLDTLQQLKSYQNENYQQFITSQLSYLNKCKQMGTDGPNKNDAAESGPIITSIQYNIKSRNGKGAKGRLNQQPQQPTSANTNPGTSPGGKTYNASTTASPDNITNQTAAAKDWEGSFSNENAHSSSQDNRRIIKLISANSEGVNLAENEACAPAESNYVSGGLQGEEGSRANNCGLLGHSETPNLKVSEVDINQQFISQSPGKLSDIESTQVTQIIMVDKCVQTHITMIGCQYNYFEDSPVRKQRTKKIIYSSDMRRQTLQKSQTQQGDQFTEQPEYGESVRLDEPEDRQSASNNLIYIQESSLPIKHPQSKKQSQTFYSPGELGLQQSMHKMNSMNDSQQLQQALPLSHSQQISV